MISRKNPMIHRKNAMNKKSLAVRGFILFALGLFLSVGLFGAKYAEGQAKPIATLPIALSVTGNTTGALPVTRGGTGQASLAAGALQSDGTNVSSGTLTVARGGTGQTSFTSGILQSNGTTITSGTVNLASTSQVTNVLPVTNGGTGQTSFTDGVLHTSGGTFSGGKVGNADITNGTIDPLKLIAGYYGQFLTGGPTGGQWVSFPLPIGPGTRLTLTTGVPVTTGNVTGASSICITPYLHGVVPVQDGSNCQLVPITTDICLTVTTLNAPAGYDVFLKNTSGITVAPVGAGEFSAAWASTTARTDALARGSICTGILVKSADPTRTYLGSFYTSGTTGSATVSDTVLLRNVANEYNRVPRPFSVGDTTDSWTYAAPNGVWRQANASTANQVQWFAGNTNTYLELRAQGMAWPTTSTWGYWGTGIGIDSTTVNSAQTYGAATASNTTSIFIGGTTTAEYKSYSALGLHQGKWLETGGGAISFTIVGDAGQTFVQNGLTGFILN